ncbi:MAG: FtsX-like permease family protein [Candidatus Ozemobacteraceae bacterium]
MKLGTLVRREILERKSQLATSFLSILLGISVIVSVQNILFFSEKAVAAELDALGANILVLPKSATLQNYYSSDLQDDGFPEEYVTRLANSDLQGLDNLSPKLSMPIEADGKRFILTGILPKNEFQAKASWQGAGIFSRPTGCGTVVQVPGQQVASQPEPKETLTRKRVIDTLEENQVLVGADIAIASNLKEGGSFKYKDTTFNVIAILPSTGTIDDSRVFAHLHTVQKMAGKPGQINAIEVVGCCEEISKGLVAKLNKLLPEAKVVTVTQIVDTQIRTNGMMKRLSLLFLGIVILIGGAGIANYMYANVYERRKEIGTLMALGAEPGFILKMFFSKALWLGLAGGIGGFILGSVLATTLGPSIVGIPVLPMPKLLAWAVGIALLITLLASYFPARWASRIDPTIALQEN